MSRRSTSCSTRSITISWTKTAASSFSTASRPANSIWVTTSPPRSTHSRIVWASALGPPPLRSKAYPLGFPWLKQRQKDKVYAANIFIDFTPALMRAAAVAKTTNYVRCLLEQPEDSGAMPHGSGVPASIWQLDKIRNLSAGSDVKISSRSGSASSGPITRSRRASCRTSRTCRQQATPGPGWPRFSQHDAYLGPLPKACGHMRRHRLVRKPGDAGFKTTGIAAYPDAMNFFLAHSFLLEFCETHRLDPGDGSAVGKMTERTSRQQVSGANLQLGGAIDIGRGSKQLGIMRSRWCNPFPVGREEPREPSRRRRFGLNSSKGLLRDVARLAGHPLLCDCKADQACHGDVLMKLAKEHDAEEQEEAGASGEGVEMEPDEDTNPWGPSCVQGDGHWGRGPPIQVEVKGSMRPLHDGAGLFPWALEA